MTGNRRARFHSWQRQIRGRNIEIVNCSSLSSREVERRDSVAVTLLYYIAQDVDVNIATLELVLMSPFLECIHLGSIVAEPKGSASFNTKTFFWT